MLANLSLVQDRSSFTKKYFFTIGVNSDHECYSKFVMSSELGRKSSILFTSVVFDSIQQAVTVISQIMEEKSKLLGKVEDFRVVKRAMIDDMLKRNLDQNEIDAEEELILIDSNDEWILKFEVHSISLPLELYSTSTVTLH